MLEQKDLIEEIFKSKSLPAEAIVANTVNNYDHDRGNSVFVYQPSLNLIYKVVELYEALVKSEGERIELMQKIFDKIKAEMIA